MNEREETAAFQSDGADSHAASPDAAPPTQIGRYRVEKVLGRGGFGLVYLAHDDKLQRLVAIKVPHRRLVERPLAAEAYLAEARTAANLDHPNIVPVHDVGATDDCPCYIVSKYIDGTDLAARLGQSRLSIQETAELVATVAEALHHAHKQGLVHRDVKPGNLLLDRSGKPFVADFGLALKEQDMGKGPGYAGTPAYMSPEQARGEGHRVDGRSDIFSLGVVLYELLVGRRPFRGDSQSDLMEQVTSFEARPPRQCDDNIPKELDRICLKALSKRATERYSTGKDMADDLRHFLAEQTVNQPSGPDVRGSGSRTVEAITPPLSTLLASSAPATPSSDHQLLKIVPKGLRSFDAHDADFFLELLPGPRDRDGLPDSLRFWKTRMEEREAEKTFAVGLICGPSGCGKSSLVKAGLLPRLSKDVISVHVEATAEETEIRLLSSLRRRCPSLPDDLALKETLAALRRRPGLPKVVIVLDQFEQWLHAKREEEHTELAEALRQCDGGRVQCVVMVRDDFWMAIFRFLRELEVRLLEGQNSAAVDLFDTDHAARVLAAFGRAFGKLPESSGATTKDQKEFLKQAIQGLAQEGKVICVRLALFAEMMKGKAWTPASLKAVGGTQGVGVTFLEETFSATAAPPEHRYHQKAARAVLKALLPESGSDIKGSMRSSAVLLDASGYRGRPRDFDDLIGILDGAIRLITPTDPEGKEEGGRMKDEKEEPSSSSLRYYQLTHDYLVPSLREWLTRKQKETRRGRAELLLTDRAAVWSVRPEIRQLPSLLQWCNIRWWTRKSNWTPPQKKMMAKASKVHAVRGLMAGILLAAAVVAGLMIRDQVEDRQKATHAAGMVDAVLIAETARVPDIIGQMAKYRKWTDPLLREEYDKAADKSRQKLRASLALAPVDDTQVAYLYDRLLDAEPQELAVIREVLAPHGSELAERLWRVVEQPEKGKERRRLRAAAALALYDADNPRWDNAAGKVVQDLVAENAVYLGLWTEAFRNVKERMLPHLFVIFVDDLPEHTGERFLAANLLAAYGADRPEIVADLLMVADAKQFAVLFSKFKEQSEKCVPLLTAAIDRPLSLEATESRKERLAKMQANAAAALLLLNQPAKAWPLLKLSADPRARSYLIHRLGPLGVDASTIVRRLSEEPDVSIQRALILSLGPEEFGKKAWTPEAKKPFVSHLQEMYATASDPGLHGAAAWLLRQWGESDWLKAEDKRLRDRDAAERDKRSAKIVPELEDLRKRLDVLTQDRPARQAAWEKRVRAQSAPLPPSLEEGLIAHYPLDETAGNRAENAVKGQPSATFQGNGEPQWLPGVLGRALRLDGHGTMVGGKPLDLEADRPFSYGCWFQYAAPIPMILLSTRDRAREYRGFDLSLEQNHQLRMQIVGEDPKSSVAKPPEYSPDFISVIATTSVDPARHPGWHHVLVTYDGSKKAKGVRIFVDGQAQPTAILTDRFQGAMRSSAPLYLGSRYDTYRFRGAIDDVRVYDRVLTEKEVRQMHEAGIRAVARLPAEGRTQSQRDLLEAAFRPLDEPFQDLSRQLRTAQAALAKAPWQGGRLWYVNGQKQTMVVIPGPVEIPMGSPPGQVRKRIGRTFAIASTLVTKEQFLRYRPQFSHSEMQRYPDPSCPIGGVTWFTAAEYCNWLSDQEGIPRDQWCYEPKQPTPGGTTFMLKEHYLSLTGYRLPTEAEMEYATRAGTSTSRYYGASEELLPRYAWYSRNSEDRTWPVGLKKPNDLGLFDMHGSLWSWCQERSRDYPQSEGPIDDEEEDDLAVDPGNLRVLRGGAFTVPASVVGSGYRNAVSASYFAANVGFRVARTLR